MTDRELMQQALEALEFHSCGDEIDETICASLRERLAQPEQEPVAWMDRHGACMSAVFKEIDATGDEYTTPLYTAPPQRKPLTDEMVKRMKENCTSMEMRGAFADGWLSAEAAHGITGEQHG